MRRLMLELALAAIAVGLVAAVSAAAAHAGNPTESPTPTITEDASGAATATPTEEPELSAPTPAPIVPPAYGDPAASRLLLVGGLYEIPPQNDCGWATARIHEALYRNYQTTSVHALHANCVEELDIFIFYPVSGELQRTTADTPRLRLQLIDGKVTISPGADGCTWTESGRFLIDSSQGPREVVTLTSPCRDDFFYQYYPDTGELAPGAPSAAPPVATATPGATISLPDTGAGSNIAPATTWIYVGNALVAAFIAVAGLVMATRGRRDD